MDVSDSVIVDLPIATPPTAPAGVTLTFAARHGRAVIKSLHQAAPCRVFFPNTEADDPALAVLVNTAGGLVGGDHVASTITLGPNTAATITTQAAEKIYRSLGPDCRVATDASAESGAYLEWLPQETILFDGARLERRLTFRLAEDAELLAAEIVFFGRSAHGESLTHGHFRDSWTIHIGGKRVWADAVCLSGDIERARRRPFGFGNAAGYATVIVAGPKAAAFLEPAREIAAASVAANAGCSLVNGVLIMRYLDDDAACLRQAVAASLVALRQRCFGFSPRLPRPWEV